MEAYPQRLSTRIFVQLGVAEAKIEGEVLSIKASRPLSQPETRALLQHASANGYEARRIRYLLTDKAEAMETVRGRQASVRSKVEHAASVAAEACRRASASGAPDSFDERIVENLLWEIIHHAAARDASDIHLVFDRAPDASYVAFRIDSFVEEKIILDADIANRVVRRFKLEAGLDFAETARPQDGRVGLRVDRRPLDIRVSSVPSSSGESLGLRLLDQTSRVGLGDLFGDRNGTRARLMSAAEPFTKTGGLVIFTGPTGSGKTTTQRALMMAVDRRRRRVVTLESPVEYRIEGAVQIEWDDETKDEAAASILRQDPDIVVIGEVRDAAGADLALKAADSGHPVFFTLHANRAAQSPQRFLSLLPDSRRRFAALVLAENLVGLVNQRLLRRLCPDCAEPFADPVSEAARFAETVLGLDPATTRLARAGGCAACRTTGYRGRAMIAEEIFVDRSSEDGVADLAQHFLDGRPGVPEGFAIRTSFLADLRRLVGDGVVELGVAMAVSGSIGLGGASRA